MKQIVRLAAEAGRAPEGAIADAIGLAVLCLMVFAAFAATGLA